MSTSKVKVTLNHGEIGAMLKTGGVASDMAARAARIAAAARSSAPVESGAYQASITSWTEVHPTRVVGRAGAGVDYAMVVEANTGNLARALDAGA